MADNDPLRIPTATLEIAGQQTRGARSDDDLWFCHGIHLGMQTAFQFLSLRRRLLDELSSSTDFFQILCKTKSLLIGPWGQPQLAYGRPDN